MTQPLAPHQQPPAFVPQNPYRAIDASARPVDFYQPLYVQSAGVAHGEPAGPAAGGTAMSSAAPRLSAQGLAILRACAASPHRLRDATCDAGGTGGAIYFEELLHEMPARSAAAKASLSRTLRRLWRAGWVELLKSGGSLTGAYAAVAADAATARADLQAAERDPERAFATAKAYGGFFPFRTPEVYLAYVRAHVLRCASGEPRRSPTRAVQITHAGRERLSACRRAVNRCPAGRRG